MHVNWNINFEINFWSLEIPMQERLKDNSSVLSKYKASILPFLQRPMKALYEELIVLKMNPKLKTIAMHQ